ncbi:hypothetical protein ACLVWQ_40075 [Streptomyces sp. CWNU-52B]|uniref:hypothetical protein n=1 Tax=unclassified Streptomyces TaxID=2593676 RepID=UPI0039BFE43D
MTESSARKALRSYLTYGAVAATIAVALLVAYLFGAFEERGNIRADDVCQSVPDRQKATKIFNSVLPQASAYDFDETQGPTAGRHFNNHCTVNGDDEDLLILSAEMVSAVPWREWTKAKIPWFSEGDRTFNAGVKGVSNTKVAAIWVPCYASERASKQPWNISVFALAIEPLEASDKKARQTLIDLATDFARQAHKDAKCDLPSQLPN